MASEYLKWKYRDVKPNPPPKPLTPKEKLVNWFYYYKWWLLAGLVLLGILGSIFWSIFTQKTPDYIFAYVGDRNLPEGQVEAFQEAVKSLGEDLNGDGEVLVELREYVSAPSSDPEIQMYYGYAANVTLMADLTAGESYFFLMTDPAEVQRSYQILANPDGSPPEEEDRETEDKVLPWGSCPALTALPVDQEAFSGLYLGRRFFHEPPKNSEALEALWQILTEGASQ